jgi:predicted RNA-binding Zn-ribbon protein involved in translation (DUF1610 family)
VRAYRLDGVRWCDVPKHADHLGQQWTCPDCGKLWIITGSRMDTKTGEFAVWESDR